MMAAFVDNRETVPLLAALLPVLPDNAAVPVRIHRDTNGIVAAYSPAQEDRASVWAMLVKVFGPLFDVTPVEVTA